MSLEGELEREVRDIIRRNRWLTLSTASLKGIPQSSVVVYASDGNTIYILTGKTTVKIRNINRNPLVSVTIPFYKSFIHRLITMAPPAAITFRARAETREFDDSEATEFYEKVLNFKVPENMEEEGIWIKLTPGNLVTCLGVGISLLEMRDLEKSYKIVRLNNP
jgi:general stress protein 26